jgi:hypothetical protein
MMADWLCGNDDGTFASESFCDEWPMPRPAPNNGDFTLQAVYDCLLLATTWRS